MRSGAHELGGSGLEATSEREKEQPWGGGSEGELIVNIKVKNNDEGACHIMIPTFNTLHKSNTSQHLLVYQHRQLNNMVLSA